MIDFSNQKDNIEKYKLPTKTLEDCPETLKLLLEENDNSNPYISLENIADDLKDIKRESRENREEMKTLRERVVIVEQSLKSYHKRLDGEQHSDR